MDEAGTHRVWAKVVSSAALGAAAMFVLDPEKGSRRRAVARDKARWIARRTGEVVDAAKRDVGSRWQGVRARTARPLHPAQSVDDDVPLDTERYDKGVVGFDNRLERRETADHVPALEGATARGGHLELQQSWTPAGRVAAVAGGALLTTMGWRRGGLSGLLMLAGGLALVTRGTTNAPLAKSRSGRAIDLQKTIEIAAPPDAVFAVWCRYETFPRFMSHVRSISDLGNGRSHWIVEGRRARRSNGTRRSREWSPGD